MDNRVKAATMAHAAAMAALARGEGDWVWVDLGSGVAWKMRCLDYEEMRWRRRERLRRDVMRAAFQRPLAARGGYYGR